MFGKNPVEKAVEGDGHSLHIVAGSPFYTIQGEGPFAGKPAVFLRLHGCPLRCYFCDTDFSDPKDPVKRLDQVVADILHASPFHSNLIVITGGEPLRQPLGPLVTQLIGQLGMQVQIETAGVFWQDWMGDSGLAENLTIVVSPKTPEIDQRVWHRADAFKYIIHEGETSEVDGLPIKSTQVLGKKAEICRPPHGHPAIFLSPQDAYDAEQNKRNRKLVGELCMKYGYRAGLQVHKYLELP